VHWASILLAGDGIAIDAPSLARDAGTALPPRDAQPSIPPGAESRRDDRLQLPITKRAEESGTSVRGVMAAIARASDHTRALVPLRANWTRESVLEVVELCRRRPQWNAVPLANVRTGRLWGSRLPLLDALEWLAGSDVAPPAPDWDVGHFVTIAATLDGPARSLLVIRDSYPQFGWDGHHLQPPEALAAGLDRGDGREGGIALYVADRDRPDVEVAAKDVGFQLDGWDNGSPQPSGLDEGGANR
jgi:hypothetical protein